MMKPEFALFVARLCVHFDAPEPKPERMDIAFDDVKHLPGSALDDIGRHIRTDSDQKLFPKNLSGVMLKAFEVIKCPQLVHAEQPDFTPPTPEQLEANRKRAEYWLPKIMAVVQSAKAPYLAQDNHEDSLKRKRAR